MAVLAPQTVSVLGTAPTYASASGGGDKVSPGSATVIHVKNGSGAAVTVTVVTPGTVGGLASADVTVSVPAAGDRFIGPISDGLFRGSDGYADVTYSSATSVTVAALVL